MRYKGSLKHKDWRPGGGFGTLCPAWTHQTACVGFRGDPEEHPWPETVAQALLDESVDGGDGRRYATRGGIAFVALESNDGTWHGFPLPWKDVPREIQNRFLEDELVERRQIRRQSVSARDLRWASDVDDG